MEITNYKGTRAYQRENAENDVSLSVIRHLGRYYDIVMKYANGKEIVEIKYEIEDIKEANEKL